MISVKVVFFASYKQRLACSELEVELENDAKIVDLCDKLSENGDKWREIFAKDASLKVACNQRLCDRQTSLKEKDEVAFFPPVTGG